jgi:hypothetical protein
MPKDKGEDKGGKGSEGEGSSTPVCVDRSRCSHRHCGHVVAVAAIVVVSLWL